MKLIMNENKNQNGGKEKYPNCSKSTLYDWSGKKLENIDVCGPKNNSVNLPDCVAASAYNQ